MKYPSLTGTNQTYIYTLCCTISHRFRYIGQSRDVDRRFADHMGLAVSGNDPKDRWIRWLQSEGKNPRLEVLAVVPTEMALEIESLFISLHAPSLFNVYGGRHLDVFHPPLDPPDPLKWLEDGYSPAVLDEIKERAALHGMTPGQYNVWAWNTYG